MQGPTAGGKTSLVKELARCTGHECVRINNHEGTDVQVPAPAAAWLLACESSLTSSSLQCSCMSADAMLPLATVSNWMQCCMRQVVNAVAMSTNQLLVAACTSAQAGIILEAQPY